MGATSGSLAPLKIPIARRGTALAGLQYIGIHRQTHAAPGLPPLEPCLAEYLVESFCLRLLLDEPRSWNHHSVHGLRDRFALRETSREPKIFNPRVRAGTDKNLVDRDIGNRHVG